MRQIACDTKFISAEAGYSQDACRKIVKEDEFCLNAEPCEYEVVRFSQRQLTRHNWRRLNRETIRDGAVVLIYPVCLDEQRADVNNESQAASLALAEYLCAQLVRSPVTFFNVATAPTDAGRPKRSRRALAQDLPNSVANEFRLRLSSGCGQFSQTLHQIICEVDACLSYTISFLL